MTMMLKFLKPGLLSKQSLMSQKTRFFFKIFELKTAFDRRPIRAGSIDKAAILQDTSFTHWSLNFTD